MCIFSSDGGTFCGCHQIFVGPSIANESTVNVPIEFGMIIMIALSGIDCSDPSSNSRSWLLLDYRFVDQSPRCIYHWQLEAIGSETEVGPAPKFH